MAEPNETQLQVDDGTGYLLMSDLLCIEHGGHEMVVSGAPVKAPVSSPSQVTYHYECRTCGKKVDLIARLEVPGP